MIKLCLYVSNVIHVNEHTEYANCGLHVNFLKFWLMSFCFMMRKYSVQIDGGREGGREREKERGGDGRLVLNEQNPLSVTKFICW